MSDALLLYLSEFRQAFSWKKKFNGGIKNRSLIIWNEGRAAKK